MRFASGFHENELKRFKRKKERAARRQRSALKRLRRSCSPGINWLGVRHVVVVAIAVFLAVQLLIAYAPNMVMQAGVPLEKWSRFNSAVIGFRAKTSLDFRTDVVHEITKINDLAWEVDYQAMDSLARAREGLEGMALEYAEPLRKFDMEMYGRYLEYHRSGDLERKDQLGRALVGSAEERLKVIREICSGHGIIVTQEEYVDDEGRDGTMLTYSW
ncbi:hypothetical protein [Anaerotalea alkaliphila]|uniref:Uncharacterized protein n=1 Tax=Anaerotalea alkaliphila TaxID=2662126 RepID=A0A7X5HVV6_9FIRM|nr:hypothetical protein [Anaerotalea alkaliphila]NDL67543.1 hypothetical protein [Anaerotalea alkaliphila]